MIKNIISFIEKNNIIYTDELIEYARKEKFSTWFPYLCSERAYVIYALIDSRRNKMSESKEEY